MLHKLLQNGRRQAFHVMNVNEDQTSVIVVIKSKEPWNQGLKKFHIYKEVCFMMGSDKDESKEL